MTWGNKQNVLFWGYRAKNGYSSFGCVLLCVLTLGIGTFFLIPYIDAAMAEFCVELKNKQA